MNTIGTLPTVDWPALLDELKAKEGIVSDAKLAASLGVTRGYICSVRKGRKGLSLDVAQTVLLRLGKTFDLGTIAELFVPIKVQQRVRSLSTIRDLVLLRAGFHCQLCDMPAPFKDADGTPYLQLHHVVSENGGSRIADNFVALCPNCHTKVQVNPTAAETEKLQTLIAMYNQQQSKVEDNDHQ